MLFLLLQLGSDRYAVAAREVIEILPLVAFKQVPHAPPEVAGLFTFRGSSVAAIDLCQLALGVPARARLSTRILLVQYRPDQLLGLIAEGVTESLAREPADFQPAGVFEPAAPYLGPVTRDVRGIIQRIEIGQLLTPAVHARLRGELEQAP